MTSLIQLRKLSGLEVPSFFDAVRDKATAKGDSVELTEMQWALISSEEKGLFENEKAYMVYEMGLLKIVPVKIINGIKQDAVTPYEDKTQATDADGGDSEKTGEDMIKA